MSYYTQYVIQCDQLTFDRMVEAWKQRGWWGRCTLCRPDYVWSASRDRGDGTKTDTYLVSAMMNRGPRSDEVEDWLNDGLGLDSMHFTLWTRGECDEEWFQIGSLLPKDTMPADTVNIEYDEDEERLDPPPGFTAYRYSDIAVDPNVWKEVTIDYTRDDDIKPQSSTEEVLLKIYEKLKSIDEQIGHLTNLMEE